MAVFAVTMVKGPSWDPTRERRQQRAWDEHAAFMDDLVERGFVILGGPIGDGDQVLVIIEATDEGEVAARLGGDPWMTMGVLQIGSVRPWAIWLDGRQRNRTG
jgi:uncharacterized protein YciI